MLLLTFYLILKQHRHIDSHLFKFNFLIEKNNIIYNAIRMHTKSAFNKIEQVKVVKCFIECSKCNNDTQP